MIEKFCCDKWYKFKGDSVTDWLNSASPKDVEFYNMLKFKPFLVTELTNDGCVERVKTFDGTSIDADDFDQWCILNDADRCYIEETTVDKICAMSIADKLELIERLISEIKAEL
ncbi:hypothetical protein CPT_Metamorpho_233 [Klebsiella phage Metamorpho]|nr:hypothetical protein CPT_Metamorpho_233 [Klebsiella phage Metamorpho]